MLVNFFGVEYLRTLSKLKKKNKKVFLEFITPSKCKNQEVSCSSMRVKKCTKNRMHVQSFANLNLLHFCPFLLWSSSLLERYYVPLL